MDERRRHLPIVLQTESIDSVSRLNGLLLLQTLQQRQQQQVGAPGEKKAGGRERGIMAAYRRQHRLTS